MKTLITNSASWQALHAHRQEIAQHHLYDLFINDTQRFSRFSLQAGELLLDYSKNRLTQQTLGLLCQLAETAQLADHIQALFTGAVVNLTEQNPALHVALRDFKHPAFQTPERPEVPSLAVTLSKMSHFVQQVHCGQWRGYDNQVITDIVNIGIGGSELGSKMVIAALQPYTNSLRHHFISSVDSAPLHKLFSELNPATSLFVITSKSFTTQETLINAKTIWDWFTQITPKNANQQHFIAITHNFAKAIAFGVAKNNLFYIPASVGGRFSLWSAAGLPIALAIGMEKFQQLLAGAHLMDQHFKNMPFRQNMPVILALLSIWYNNFFAASAQAILPYDHGLRQLPAYLQQLEMESGGKHITWYNQTVDYATQGVLFGEAGTNGQHAFHQLLHQGTRLIPVDFIVPMQTHYPLNQHHAILVAHAFSQSKALMDGKTLSQACDELHKQNLSAAQIEKIAPHLVLPGNQPSNMLVFPQLTPITLGNLIALYEHKTYVQSIIWQINAFDQWGVELGKQLAKDILPELLDSAKPLQQHDASTKGLIEYYRKVNYR